MSHRKLKILIIDSHQKDYISTALVFNQIPDRTFSFHWSATYDEGLSEVLHGKYEFCLINYHLDIKNGTSLITELRTLGSKLPLILLINQDDTHISAFAIKAGASDYLVKSSLDAATLNRTIRNSLQQAIILQMLEDEKSSIGVRIKKRTEELTDVNEQLTQLAKSKDNFLAAMSHELRTPLTGVLAMAEMLRDELYGNMNTKQIEIASNIYQNGLHLLELINDVLDIAKIDADKLEIYKTEVLVKNVCAEAINLIKPQVKQRRQTLKITIDKGIKTIYADERRLKQILINLLSNAIKFTPKGGEIGL